MLGFLFFAMLWLAYISLVVRFWLMPRNWTAQCQRLRCTGHALSYHTSTQIPEGLDHKFLNGMIGLNLSQLFFSYPIAKDNHGAGQMGFIKTAINKWLLRVKNLTFWQHINNTKTMKNKLKVNSIRRNLFAGHLLLRYIFMFWNLRDNAFSTTGCFIRWQVAAAILFNWDDYSFERIATLCPCTG